MTSFLKDDRSRAVAWWLFAVAALVLAMVVVGGATRLTDSGLSITEWKPVTGAIPPMSDAAWAREFAGYQKTTQYAEVNAHMSIDDFKSIFWWEWAHRLLGRIAGVAFALPFAWFLLRRQVPRRLIWRCFGLLALGALQGAVGWWMVKSGLSASELISVAPERLMIHLSLALLLFMGLLWCGFEAYAGQGRLDAHGPWARGGLGLTVLIFIQSMLGALVAANDAGKVNNDWPLMNGRFFPSGYAADGVWQTFAHSIDAVQFNHRVFGYLVFFLLVAFAVTARRSRHVQPEVRRGAYLLSGLGVLQVLLGIATVLLVAPLSLSIAHQILATLLLGVSVWLTWRARRL